MRATIVVDDNIVLVDGEPQRVDCSPLIADGVHAVQWYDTVGEVEFRSYMDMARTTVTRKPNETITDFAPYQSYVDAWAAEKARQELEASQKPAEGT